MTDDIAIILGVISLGGVILAAVAGIGGALLGSRIGAGATRRAAEMGQEESRADRAAALSARDAERTDARRDRFADRKLTLAVDLLLAADEHNRQAHARIVAVGDRMKLRLDFGEEAADAIEIPTIGSSELVRQAMLSLELMAPAMAPAAMDLYQATVKLGALSAQTSEHGSHDREQRDLVEWPREWIDAESGWNVQRFVFVDAARADLGVDADTR